MGIIERGKKVEDVCYLLYSFVNDVTRKRNVADRRSKEVIAVGLCSRHTAIERVHISGGVVSTPISFVGLSDARCASLWYCISNAMKWTTVM